MWGDKSGKKVYYDLLGEEAVAHPSCPQGNFATSFWSLLPWQSHFWNQRGVLLQTFSLMPLGIAAPGHHTLYEFFSHCPTSSHSCWLPHPYETLFLNSYDIPYFNCCQNCPHQESSCQVRQQAALTLVLGAGNQSPGIVLSLILFGYCLGKKGVL